MPNLDWLKPEKTTQTTKTTKILHPPIHQKHVQHDKKLKICFFSFLFYFETISQHNDFCKANCMDYILELSCIYSVFNKDSK